MTFRFLPWAAIATLLACAPATGSAQELAMAPAVALPSMPSAPPVLSPECRSKRIVGEMFRRPLKALSRAVRTNKTAKVLAIGSSSTAGVGASSPAATYVANLETTLEGSFKGMNFEVIGRGMSGEIAEGAADRMKREVDE